MVTDSANVRVAVSGQVLVGATTAAAPTSTAALAPVGFADCGFVSEDGVTETRDRSSDDIKAWQNAATVRTVVTDASLTYQFTLIETNETTVGLFYGAEVDGADGSLVIIPSATGGRRSFIIDAWDGDAKIRTYIPQGEVTEVGDKVYASGEAIGYEVTISAYPDPSILSADGASGSAKQWSTALVAA